MWRTTLIAAGGAIVGATPAVAVGDTPLAALCAALASVVGLLAWLVHSSNRASERREIASETREKGYHERHAESLVVYKAEGAAARETFSQGFREMTGEIRKVGDDVRAGSGCKANA